MLSYGLVELVQVVQFAKQRRRLDDRVHAVDGI